MLRRCRWLIIVVAVFVVAGAVVVAKRVTSDGPGSDPSAGSIAAGGAEAWASPTGSGDRCSHSEPCGSIADAFKTLPKGGTVFLLGGHYADERLDGGSFDGKRSAPLIVRPGPGVSNAVLGLLKINIPMVRLEKVMGDGIIYFDRGADDSALTDSHLAGSGDDGSTNPSGPSVIVRADRVLVQNNLIEHGHIHDGINVAGYPQQNTGVRIIGNTVRDFSEGTSRQEHADCLQVFDSDDLLVVNNTFYSCYNSAIIVSPGSRQGTSRAVIEGNFLEGCLPARIQCGEARTSVDIRTIEAKSVIFNHNTVVNGSARLPGNAGVQATNNIIGYLSIADCATSLTNSLVGDYSTALCKTGLPGTGNVLGTAQFMNETNGDLRLRVAVPRPAPVGARLLDRDGKPLGVVGASQP